MKLQVLLILLFISGGLAACTVTHTSTSQYPDGQRKRIYQYYFNDDRVETRHGAFREWYKNGELKTRGTYDKGQLQGAYEIWYPNGERQAKGSYDQGKRIGEWTFFHINGQKRATGTYKNDFRVGVWSFWANEGTLHTKVTYPTAGEGELERESLDDPQYGSPIAEDGTLRDFCDKDDIRAEVDSFRERLKECYERELSKDHELSGMIISQWKVGLGGEVLSSGTAKSTINNRSVEECISHVIEKMQFQPPNGGICVINYPFKFSGI